MQGMPYQIKGKNHIPVTVCTQYILQTGSGTSIETVFYVVLSRLKEHCVKQ
jgi:hypothetical protein